MKTMALLEMEQLVAQGCSNPECKDCSKDEIFVQQRCHPGTGLDVRYGKGTGVINVLCRECKKPIIDIGVALM